MGKVSAFGYGFLPPASGNGGTTTLQIGDTIVNNAVAGGVLFVAFAAGQNRLSMNPNNFFWDESNLRLGLGTNAPSQKLHAFGGASDVGVLTDANSGLQNKAYIFGTGGDKRWDLNVFGNNTGANVGDDFSIRRYNDAGALIDTPISIVRSTGVATINGKTMADKLDVTTATTAANISFVVPQIYNSPASPKTGNVTNDLTGANIGIVQKIYHQQVGVPSFPVGWVLVGTGGYVGGTLNIIYAEWVSGTRVEYWIVQ